MKNILTHMFISYSNLRMMNVSGASLFWCGAFFFLGPILILVNNHVLNQVHYKYPILFSSLGLWGTAVVSQLSQRLGFTHIEKRTDLPSFMIKKVIPIGILSAATIGAGNSVYLYLSVSFTQMLKALTPVYILLCLVLFGVEFPKQKVVIAVLLISLGTAIASLGELKFSWTGFILQSLADLFEGSRLVILQLFMANEALSPVESMYYISPATAISQFVLVLIYERQALTDSRSWAIVSEYWYYFLAGMSLGIAINFVGLFVIKHTSGLMLKLIGVVRNNCLVLFSIMFMHEQTSQLQVAGYVLSVIGFFWYTSLTQKSKKAIDVPPKRDYTRVVDEEEMKQLCRSA